MATICVTTATLTLVAIGVIYLIATASIKPWHPPRATSPRSSWLKKIDSLSQEIESNPDQAELYLQRAKAILSHMQEVIDRNSFPTKYSHADVVADLDAAIQCDPKMGEPHLEKGVVLL